MQRVLKFTVMGCGGLSALVIFICASVALLEGGSAGSAPGSAEKQQSIEQGDMNGHKARHGSAYTEEEEKQAGIEASPSSSVSLRAGGDVSGPKVKITRVVDGDTIEVAPSVDGEDTVRLIGIDAPERARQGCGAQPVAQEAAEWAALFWSGVRVRLEFGENRTDRY